MDGIFSIAKTTGMTSHDVVARVRRLAGQKRVGHAGTLDPAASGVLPMLLGQATRVAEYLSEGGKAYRATVRFGSVTDTYDGEGRVVRTALTDGLTLDAIRAALPAFLGEQMQRPPAYSAIKRAGRPLYELARTGAEVTPEPRRVRIDALTVVAWRAPDLVLDVECGKGTYIRSLAYDLGERLGTGAHLAALERTRSGPFTLAESVTLEALGRALDDGSWPEHLYAPDVALLDRRAAILGAASEARLRTGQPLRFAPAAAPPSPLPSGSAPPLPVGSTSSPLSAPSGPPLPPGEGPGVRSERLLRAYSADGRFLGVLRWEPALAVWQPHKVLAVAPVE